MIKTYQDLIDEVEKVKIDKNIDLSSGEDLSVGLMNLIGIEEHLFFTLEKTKNGKYLDLLNEVRLLRTDLMKKIVKDPEGEVWCISKHLLAASMRVMEVGTKELKKGNKKEAASLFEKSYKLYSLFWALNLSKSTNVRGQIASKILFTNDKNDKKTSESAFSKLGVIIQKALDCCRE
jgi:D-Tyr-tRNAtyr deacylase